MFQVHYTKYMQRDTLPIQSDVAVELLPPADAVIPQRML